MLGNRIEVAKVVKEIKNINDISESLINENYLLKATYLSKCNIEMKNKTMEYISKKINEWNENFSYKQRDDAIYKTTNIRFFIEEKIEDSILGKTGKAIVYMFRCIHGIPITVGVKYDTKQNIYDTNFNIIQKNLNFDIEKPQNWIEIIEVVKELSKIFEFVRIDLYLGINNKIYFSEFTFFPNHGIRFFSKEKEMEYGKLWK